MLPTKFQVNWPFGSGEEAKSSFPDGGHGDHLGLLIGTILAVFLSKSHTDASHQVRKTGLSVQERKKNRFSR